MYLVMQITWIHALFVYNGLKQTVVLKQIVIYLFWNTVNRIQ